MTTSSAPTELISVAGAHLAPQQMARWEAVMEAWLLEQESGHTRAAYRRTLTEYAAFLAALGVADPLAARRPHVAAYAEGMRTVRRPYRATVTVNGEKQTEQRERTGYAPATIAQRLAIVSSFYAYAVAEEALDRNPAAAVRRPKINPDYTPTLGLTAKESMRLLATAAAWRHGPAHRAHALVALLLAIGLRIGEATGLNLGVLGYERGHHTITVIRKGGSLQRLAVPGAVWDILGDYLFARGVAERRTDGSWQLLADVDRDAPLFATSRGRRLDEPAAWRLTRRLAAAANLPSELANRLNPHGLRHTKATLALDAGAKLEEVQDELGHADPRTTQKYNRNRHRLNNAPSYRVAARLFHNEATE